MPSDQPIVQWNNSDQVDLLRPYFVDRNEPNYAWQHAVSAVLALPALRAFWPMSSVDFAAASRARDIAGSGYHLADNNTVLFSSGEFDALPNLVPFAEFDGVNQYLSRADGGAANWADIIGTEAYVAVAQRGLTIGGWFKFDQLARLEYLIAKLFVPAQFSYRILKDAANNIVFGTSVGGGGLVSATSTNAVNITDWWFIVGRFRPSAFVDIFVNSIETSAVTADATIFDSTAPVTIGAQGTPNLWMDGRASLCWLCAAALSNSIISALYHSTRKLYNV